MHMAKSQQGGGNDNQRPKVPLVTTASQIEVLHLADVCASVGAHLRTWATDHGTPPANPDAPGADYLLARREMLAHVQVLINLIGQTSPRL